MAFQKFYDEASRLAEEMDIKIAAATRPRKVSRRLDGNPDSQHFLTSNKEIFMKF